MSGQLKDYPIWEYGRMTWNSFMLRMVFSGLYLKRGHSSKILLRRGIKELLLVCSSYHGRRVGIAFSTYLKDDGVKLKIFPVDEKVPLIYLLVEYMKLILYENFLIPLEVHTDDTHGEKVAIQKG